jgi:hypothetical protein
LNCQTQNLGAQAGWNTGDRIRAHGAISYETRKIIFGVAIMRKWIVRLIGCLFLLLALSELIDLITGTRSTKGFYGIRLLVGVMSDQVDIMVWIGVVIEVCTGYYLIRLEERGRRLVLFLLFLSIGQVILAMFIAISSANWSFSHTPLILRFAEQSYEIDNPPGTLLVIAGMVIFYGSGIYFFTRKDTKTLFQKPEPIQEKS